MLSYVVQTILSVNLDENAMKAKVSLVRPVLEGWKYGCGGDR